MLRLRVFRCPGCGEFIAATAAICRFCSRPIDAAAAKAAADAQDSENSGFRTKKYVRHICIGAALYVVGNLIALATRFAGVSEQPEYVFLTVGLTMSGFAELLYGIVGYIRES